MGKLTVKVKHDLYSLGMIFVEIFTQDCPFSHEARESSWKEVIEAVITTRRTPCLTGRIASVLKDLVEKLQCDPPTLGLKSVKEIIRSNRPSSQGIVETLLSSMEGHLQVVSHCLAFLIAPPTVNHPAVK